MRIETMTNVAVDNAVAIASVNVRTKEFVKELEWVTRFAERRTTIPILANILIEARDGTLTLTSTDLELGGIATLPVAMGVEFAYTFPAHLALKYLKKVKDTDIRLVLETKTHLRIPEVKDGEPAPEPIVDHSYRFMMQHGEDSEIEISGISRDQYPELPVHTGERGVINGLTAALPRVIVAVSAEESRFTLNGALFICGKRGVDAKFVSTDGHRLSMVEVDAFSKEPCRLLIPRQALSEVVKLGDSVEFGFDDNHTFFFEGNRQIVARKLTGSFPDYERVLPKREGRSVSTVEAEPLRKAIERVEIFSDERSKAIRLKLTPNRLTVNAMVSEVGSAKASVASTWSGDSDKEWVGGFNAGYLLDFLKLAPPAVAVDLTFIDYNALIAKFDANGKELPKPTSCEGPITLELPGWSYTVMPMRM